MNKELYEFMDILNDISNKVFDKYQGEIADQTTLHLVKTEIEQQLKILEAQGYRFKRYPYEIVFNWDQLKITVLVEEKDLYGE